MMIQKSRHQIAVPLIVISLVFFLFTGACSQDEKPLPSSQPQKIVKAISKAPGLAKAEKPQINENSRPEPEEKSSVETRPASHEERGLERLKRETKEVLPRREAGYYVVKKGDTLTGIAAREDVYGDPLKWPILGRHNLNELNPISMAEDFPNRALPEGMKLRFFTRDEVENNLKERGKKRWAVNVLSSPDEKEVVPVVVRLIRAGFPVYITHANIRGTDYMRVRVGFFGEKTEADVEGKSLMAVLKFPDFWTIKAEEEMREFGGY